ncbi:sulfotransferase [Nonomuraea sp. SYSU D8015]|uniref:sulfotransferase n=1 Tax=Nonomuraea sp. SYSU D8015 TaxID=2593644 RepID=UPI0016611E32|nr:sulfotransferase [Nonomuraea sp. SYSU D8015]
MNWQRKVNKALVRFTGFQIERVGKEPPPAPVPEIRRPADPLTDRLLEAPVFLLSPVRSGSTLLRSILNAHSALHAPHELHIRRLRVHLNTGLAAKATAALGHARFLFLLRHPASIATSWHEAGPDKRTPEEAALDALRYMKAVQRARKASAPSRSGSPARAGHARREDQIPEALKPISRTWGYVR